MSWAQTTLFFYEQYRDEAGGCIFYYGLVIEMRASAF